MYNYGSTASELEQIDSFYGAEVRVDEKKKTAARIAERQEKLKRKALRSLCVIAALLAVVMIREAQIDKLCGEITKIESNIESLNAMITEKEIYLSGQLDMNTIEEIAISRLGMQRPLQEQYKPLNVNKEDGGEILVENSTQNGGFSAFIGKAKILLEYLY